MVDLRLHGSNASKDVQDLIVPGCGKECVKKEFVHLASMRSQIRGYRNVLKVTRKPFFSAWPFPDEPENQTSLGLISLIDRDQFDSGIHPTFSGPTLAPHTHETMIIGSDNVKRVWSVVDRGMQYLYQDLYQDPASEGRQSWPLGRSSTARRDEP